MGWGGGLSPHDGSISADRPPIQTGLFLGWDLTHDETARGADLCVGEKKKKKKTGTRP